jgi:hypothetical protein
MITRANTTSLVLASLSWASISSAEIPTLPPDRLKAYGFTTEQSIESKPCIFRLILDQAVFNEIVPKLLELGMLGNGQSLEFASHHTVSLENVLSLSIMFVLTRQAYATNPTMDGCVFEGHFLVPDDYGHAQDRLAYSFEFDRALFNRIDWDRMEARNLVKVAKEFHLSEWDTREVGKEPN